MILLSLINYIEHWFCGQVHYKLFYCYTVFYPISYYHGSVCYVLMTFMLTHIHRVLFSTYSPALFWFMVTPIMSVSSHECENFSYINVLYKSIFCSLFLFFDSMINTSHRYTHLKNYLIPNSCSFQHYSFSTLACLSFYNISHTLFNCLIHFQTFSKPLCLI